MRMISPAALRSQYTPGTRVELLQMEDIQAPPVGTKGTVIGIDDTGSLMMRWDNGSGLNVLYGIDRCRIITEEAKGHTDWMFLSAWPRSFKAYSVEWIIPWKHGMRIPQRWSCHSTSHDSPHRIRR